ncbi:multidrug effflux MFS transporter [Elongatibacter sediminis]|uniref:Multidrug effflux MFS transporter n=1 Tax=Elongatibacter sediminis TaxID=3119006 RepID=A0AAW9R4U2_9GAMM
MPSKPDTGHPEMRRLRIQFILALAGALSTLSMDFFAPAMPSVTRDFGTTPEAVKTLMTLFLLGYGFGPFIWGALADRIGRRKVMLLGVGGYVLAALGCLLSPTITGLFVFRVAQGFCASSTAIIARAVLRDVYGSKDATKAIAGMFLIMVWVPVLAPIAGGLLSGYFDWRANFFVMMCGASAIWAASFIWLRETRPEDDGANPRGRRWTAVLSHPVFLRHTLTNMFLFGALLFFLSNYSYITEARFGFDSSQNGLLLTVFNATIAGGFYLVWAVAPRLGVDRSIGAGLLTACAGWCAIFAMSVLPEPPLLLILPCVVVASLGTGLVVSLAAGEALTPFTHAAGTASALFVLVQSMGAALLNFVAGSLFEATLPLLASVLALFSVGALLASFGFRTRGSADHAGR